MLIHSPYDTKPICSYQIKLSLKSNTNHLNATLGERIQRKKMIRFLRSSILSTNQVRKKCENSLFQLNCVRLYSQTFDVNVWLESLDEAQQKRIKFIQNEVKYFNSKLTEATKTRISN